MFEKLRDYLPSVGVLAASVAVLIALRVVMHRGQARVPGRAFRNELILLGLSGAAAAAVILALPVESETRDQILTFLGIVVSALIAFASTTVLSNAMAGIMLRALGKFRIGDFLRVESHFGRVSERGLVHTEIQTEDRDLTTLPNLYLASHPVTVIRASGTILSATVSLGYDEKHTVVRDLLIEAALRAGLEEPFVQIQELGDFSISYRVAGLLKDVKQVITCRSELRVKMLEALHQAGVEIVSPSFMNTRSLSPRERVIPTEPVVPADELGSARDAPERLIFDKANRAAEIEKMRRRREKLSKKLEALAEQSRAAPDDSSRDRVEAEIASLRSRQEALDLQIARGEDELHESEDDDL